MNFLTALLIAAAVALIVALAALDMGNSDYNVARKGARRAAMEARINAACLAAVALLAGISLWALVSGATAGLVKPCSEPWTEPTTSGRPSLSLQPPAT